MKAKLLVSTAFLAASVSLSAQKSATITVHADQGKEIIPKEIYGQFAEHLGSCIYGGLWVGENSDIPNIKGYRTEKEISQAASCRYETNLRTFIIFDNPIRGTIHCSCIGRTG